MVFHDKVDPMHETAIADALIAGIERELVKSGGKGRVTGVSVAMGRLAGVDPEALCFAFEALSSGTCADGAELTVREIKARCRCNSCGWKGETDDLFCPCPQCGGLDVSIEGPRDLVLESIEIEEPGDAGIA
jgi:hydrogenase nickel incorporation protein HypA/HybF